MFPSFLITFREGLEAFLLVGIMLSYLSKMGASRFGRYIYMGVAAGLVASLITAVLFQVVIDQFENERYRHILMLSILGFAAAVLSYMAIWMQKQAKAHASEVERDLEQHLSTGNLMGMVLLSAVAVLREGFETVLFFSALAYSTEGGLELKSGLIGGSLGLATSIAVVALLMRGTRKVPIQVFFKYSSLLLILIAAGFVSTCVNLLQALNWLPVLIPHLFDISWLVDDSGTIGIFLRALFGFNSSPGLLQFGSWVAYLAVFIALWRRGYAVR
jgi:high-affinity iron transporter